MAKVVKRLALCLLLEIICGASLASAVAVRHVILDLDETIIQREQEYSFDDNAILPRLEAIHIDALYPDSSIQERTYYLRRGAAALLEYLAQEKKRGRIDVSILSFSHQHRLNAILDNIIIAGEPLSNLVHVAFGAEAIERYHGLKGRPGKRLKDISLVFIKDSIKIWKALKLADFSALDLIETRSSSIPSDILMIDDRPEFVIPEQQNQTIRIKYTRKSNEYWQEFAKNTEIIASSLDSYEAARFLAKHDIEASQYHVLETLLENARASELPNPYQDWEALMRSEGVLALEHLHFRYLLADLLQVDSPDTQYVFIGRDTDLLHEAMTSLKKSHLVHGEVIYTVISRKLAASHQGALREVLCQYGVDIEEAITGKKKLVFVDNGFAGTLPKAFIRAIVGDRADWQQVVKNISCFLVTTPAEGIGVREFENFESYLRSGGYLLTPLHQMRTGLSGLREIVHYWEAKRPKFIKRTERLDKNGMPLIRDTHPSERRFALVLHDLISSYFKRPDIHKFILKRMDFARSLRGNYPSAWYEEEPKNMFVGKILNSTERAVAIQQTKNMDLSAKELGIQKYTLHGREYDVPFVRLAWDAKNDQVEWYDYKPTFAHEEPFGEPNIVPQALGSLERLYEIRKRGLQALSRSAQGLHKKGQSKVLNLYGLELAQATLASHERATDYLIEHALDRVLKVEDMRDFVLSLASIYLTEVKPRNASPFRQWHWGKDDVSHPCSMIEKDWIWFLEWLTKEINSDYDPFLLGSKLHFYIARQLHPFFDATGKVARDMTDWVFIRKGFMPLAWSVQADKYETHIKTLQGTYDYLLEAYGQGSSKKQAPLRRKTP